MSPQTETCPGCGASVHPGDVTCPECGHDLAPPPAPRRVLPLVVGVAGVLVALAAGAGVWVLLSPKAPQQQAAAVAPAPATPSPPAAPPAPEPPPTPIPQPAAPNPPPAAQASTAPTLQTVPANGLRPSLPPIPSDPGTRRDYAKSTQDAFKENGLDMTVAATGENATVMTLKFNFPAKTAVDLISGGPFPRQCKARGFKQVVFVDPNGTSWTLDLETDKLTQK